MMLLSPFTTEASNKFLWLLNNKTEENDLHLFMPGGYKIYYIKFHFDAYEYIRPVGYKL